MCKNMQELLQYVANKRKQRSFQHYKLAKTDGECGSFTDKEYKRIIEAIESINDVEK